MKQIKKTVNKFIEKVGTPGDFTWVILMVLALAVAMKMHAQEITNSPNLSIGSFKNEATNKTVRINLYSENTVPLTITILQDTTTELYFEVSKVYYENVLVYEKNKKKKVLKIVYNGYIKSKYAKIEVFTNTNEKLLHRTTNWEFMVIHQEPIFEEKRYVKLE